MIVADNSVLIGLVFELDDYHADAVRARRLDARWHAPLLVRSELRSVAARFMRRDPAKTAAILDALADAELAIQEHHALSHAEVLAVTAAAAKLSAYDAEYVALARRLGCKLVTTDKLVIQAFPDVAVRLADFVR